MPSYAARAKHCQNPTAKKLLQLMEAKQTNLAVSADVTEAEQLIQLTKNVGDEICVLKTHIDIIENFSPAVTDELAKLANTHEFLIFEDRKFADIGNTVKLQYSKGIYHISQWAHIINAHTVPGPGIIEGLKAEGLAKGHALLLLAEMSSQGNLMNEAYQQQTLDMARKHPDFVIGFITQHKLTDDPNLINFTPGVNMQSKDDKLGQQYNTPTTAITEHGADVIIVGRGIYQADDPRAAAQQYRQAGWQAYCQRLG